MTLSRRLKEQIADIMTLAINHEHSNTDPVEACQRIIDLVESAHTHVTVSFKYEQELQKENK